MSFARTTAGGALRRLAGGPEARRCTAAMATTQSKAPLPSPQTPSSSTFSSPSPFFIQASSFHTSAPRPARRRPRFSNVSAVEMGLVDDTSISKFAKKHLPDYTEAEKQLLSEKYTPAQMAAVQAGEEAVSQTDIVKQGRFRNIDEATQAGINYFDDFSKVQPIIDHRFKDPNLAKQVPARFTTMEDDRFTDDLEEWLKGFIPEGEDIQWDQLSLKQRAELADKYAPSDMDVFKYLYNRPALVHGKDQARVLPEELGNSSLALGTRHNIPGMSDEYTRSVMQPDPDDEGLDEAGNYKELTARTGLKVSEIFNLATKEIVVRMVSNQTRLGKVRSYSVIAMAGNGNGRLGLGSFKSTEFTIARSRAREAAVRNMRPIPRYEKRTIYGNVEHKISGTVVRLFSRPPGFGLRVPHHIFEMARAAGIQDLAAKIPRSRNPMNVVKATYAALMNQRDPEQIAIGRGKKLVDVRKVYFGGAVY
ncbi:28S ribosomal protein S5, mitochondrial [Sporothrix stenoceras]|uniref:28S ribosomal protein S5, mitochondrial n=1 Tax=Sporothrix stenoceras TaxID=5173 RepID=A0ABR3ZN04_9PEZI